MSETPLVTLSGVGKQFLGGRRALVGLDVAIRTGERLVLLGASGCGKSTALRLVAGLEAPSEGRIDRANIAPRDIGFVFQDATLMPWADAFSNVWLPLRLRGSSRAAAAPAVRDALARVGLSGVETSLPHQLSGGQRMRVAIARALVATPRLLLMDEPFAALDELTRVRLNDDLLKLVAELGTTLVFVTHSVAEAVYLATRIAVFPAAPGPLYAILPVPEGPHDRGSAAFAAQCAAVSATLAAAAT